MSIIQGFQVKDFWVTIIQDTVSISTKEANISSVRLGRNSVGYQVRYVKLCVYIYICVYSYVYNIYIYAVD